jgi:retinol dehydrogenase-12
MLAELDSNKDCFQGSERRDMERYNTSKLLNVLWPRELSDRVSNAHLNVVINTVNPGLCASSLHRSDPRAAQVVSVLAWTATQGGHCLSDAATQHEAHPGAYISEQAVKP